MAVPGASRYERFFREAASLDVDRHDARRLNEFVSRKTNDMLVAAEATATANGRDIVEPRDFPITRALQQHIDRFEKLDRELGMAHVLDDAVGRPAIDLSLSDEAERGLPCIAGGMSLALAQLFTVIDPEVRNPASAQWRRAMQVFDLLV
jgi:hypothetical protein